MTRDELNTKLFLRYGKYIQIISKDNEFDINKTYKFRLVHPVLKETIKDFEEVVNVLIYRNFYWKVEPEELSLIYSNEEDIDKYQKNDKVVFMIPIDGNEVAFKPDYINITSKEVMHYFDQSYYINKIDHPKDILKAILDYFNNEEEYILQMIEMF